jgi:type IV pilus assembly protein PilA
MHSKNNQFGVTVMQFMIAVAIFVLVAALVKPWLEERTKREKVLELVVAALTCKVAVAEAYQGGSLPKGGLWGCEMEKSSPYIDFVRVSENGQIQAQLRTGIDATMADGRHLSLTPYADETRPMSWADAGKPIYKWVCTGGFSPNDRLAISASLLPGFCRN